MLVCYLQYTIIGELIIYCSKSQLAFELCDSDDAIRWRLEYCPKFAFELTTVVHYIWIPYIGSRE